MTEIQVCIGTEPKMRVPALVLEDSINRNLSRDYTAKYHWMVNGFWDAAPKGVTGFSFRRWMIPRYFDFKGRAIYLDADQVCYSDLSELWHAPDRLPAKDPNTYCWLAYKGSRPLPSVMVIECDRARQFQTALEKVEAGEWNRQRVMSAKWIRPRPVDVGYEWNHIDVFSSGAEGGQGHTKILHFSDLKRQPWFDPDHPYAERWICALENAIASGVVNHADYTEFRGLFGRRKGLHPQWCERADRAFDAAHADA